MSFQVRRVPAAATYPLRRELLRPHQRLEELRLAGDDDPETGSFAAVAPDGTVLATASVRREACPWRRERQDAWRLRGMATAAEVRGRGVGAEVLTSAVAHVAGAGGGLLWCNARTPALSFYARAGFTVHGPEWEEPQIGPHVRMWREVGGPQRPDPAAR